MKKLGFLLFLLFISSPLPAEKTVMDNRWGYSYPNLWGVTNVSQVSFQNIENNMYAVLVREGRGKFEYVDFKNNTGRGLYLHPDVKQIALNQMYFYNNAGGAAFFGVKEQSITHSVFEHNSAASGWGGALYIPNNHTLTAQNVSFSNNSASKGGAVYAGGDLTVRGGNLTFSNNSADQGGGIYASGNLTLVAEGGDITFNSNAGGAVYMGSASGRLSLQPTASGNIIFNDTIGSAAGTNVDIAGAANGRVIFYRSLPNVNLNLKSGGVYLNPDITWNNTEITALGGSLLLADGTPRPLHVDTVALVGTLHMVPEVDLQTGIMDTLKIDQALGTGIIQVDGFRFLQEGERVPAALDFMTAAGKEAVRVPDTAYGKLYAYGVDYNPETGQIYFAPKPLNTSDGFAPGALIQPVRSYLALLALSQSVIPLQHRWESRFLHYDEVSSSFYVVPYMSGGRVEFTNNLSADTSVYGVQAGWGSADWGLFEAFTVTGGFNIGWQTGTAKYHSVSSDMTLVQGGGDLQLYNGGFYMGLTAQAAAVSSEETGDVQTQVGLWGNATMGWHMDLSDNGWILFPTVSVGYGLISKANDILYNDYSLSGTDFSLLQLKGGMQLIKSYNDAWHWYIGGDFVKQRSGRNKFTAADQELPVFETDPYIQASAGFQTENDGHFAFGGEVNARFGSVQQFGGYLTVQF